METYSLYPDVKDFNENSNVIKNSILDDPIGAEYPYKRAVFISDAMHDRFLVLVNQDWDWRYDQNCAEFGCEIFRKVTGEEIEMNDRLGYETPRMVGKGIKDNNAGRNDNTNPKWWIPIERSPPFKGPRNRRNRSDGSSYDGSY